MNKSSPPLLNFMIVEVFFDQIGFPYPAPSVNCNKFWFPGFNAQVECVDFSFSANDFHETSYNLPELTLIPVFWQIISKNIFIIC